MDEVAFQVELADHLGEQEAHLVVQVEEGQVDPQVDLVWVELGVHSLQVEQVDLLADLVLEVQEVFQEEKVVHSLQVAVVVHLVELEDPQVDLVLVVLLVVQVVFQEVQGVLQEVRGVLLIQVKWVELVGSLEQAVFPSLPPSLEVGGSVDLGGLVGREGQEEMGHVVALEEREGMDFLVVVGEEVVVEIVVVPSLEGWILELRWSSEVEKSSP